MLMRTDPFRELDRITQQVFGTAARPAAMPMDAYRHGGEFFVHLDLPGIDPDSISLTAEQNVLTIRAERAPAQPDDAELLIAERPYGTYTRQVFLGETLDADKVAADYAAGVLTLTIPASWPSRSTAVLRAALPFVRRRLSRMGAVTAPPQVKRCGADGVRTRDRQIMSPPGWPAWRFPDLDTEGLSTACRAGTCRSW
jgi:HSP20 family protein